ncbi:hypothetical protein ACQW02_17505 [Humitalea sp. 24SJ18S-53]|uniref:hypothetical protein n=1 Tax=Humitalea sp. 24SJ18S-53 TaxID=3422307 RepID=UPI003D672EBA
MNDPSRPSFRPAPQAGDHVWHGEALSPDAWMLALGAEAAAEIGAGLAGAAGLPGLTPLLGDLALRLDHGRGLAVLRGLPAEKLAPDAATASALLALLGAPIGRPIAEAGSLTEAPGAADAWLLLASGAEEIMLASAAAAHNAVMAADRAALVTLFTGEPPAFSAQGGSFAGRRVLSAALDAALAQPGAALRLHLRAGDVLAINPSLVWWLGPPPAGLTGLPLATEPSRLGLPVWADLRPVG